MLALRIMGVMMLVLSFSSTSGIFLIEFGKAPAGNVFTMWMLFLFTFLAGMALVLIGASRQAVARALGAIVVALLVVALLAAASIFLNMMGMIAVAGTASLWILFVACTLVGVAALVFAEDMKKPRHTLAFDDEEI